MENITLEGKILQKLQAQEGVSTRGAWKKQEFIIETKEQYPKKVCVACWGDKVGDLDNFQINDEIRVAVNIESREYNSRWYTDIKAWKIESMSHTPPAQSNTPNAIPENDDIVGMSFSEEDDSLPF
jgi:hypothetical protein